MPKTKKHRKNNKSLKMKNILHKNNRKTKKQTKNLIGGIHKRQINKLVNQYMEKIFPPNTYEDLYNFKSVDEESISIKEFVKELVKKVQEKNKKNLFDECKLVNELLSIIKDKINSANFDDSLIIKFFQTDFVSNKILNCKNNDDALLIRDFISFLNAKATFFFKKRQSDNALKISNILTILNEKNKRLQPEVIPPEPEVVVPPSEEPEVVVPPSEEPEVVVPPSEEPEVEEKSVPETTPVESEGESEEAVRLPATEKNKNQFNIINKNINDDTSMNELINIFDIHADTSMNELINIDKSDTSSSNIQSNNNDINFTKEEFLVLFPNPEPVPKIPDILITPDNELTDEKFKKISDLMKKILEYNKKKKARELMKQKILNYFNADKADTNNYVQKIKDNINNINTNIKTLENEIEEELSNAPIFNNNDTNFIIEYLENNINSLSLSADNKEEVNKLFSQYKKNKQLLNTPRLYTEFFLLLKFVKEFDQKEKNDKDTVLKIVNKLNDLIKKNETLEDAMAGLSQMIPQPFEIETSNNNNGLSQYNKIKNKINEIIQSIKSFINDGYVLLDSQEEQEEADTTEGEEPKKYLKNLLETLKNNINSLKTKSNNTKEDIIKLLNIDFNRPFNELKDNLSDKLNKLSGKLNNLLDNSKSYKLLNDDNGIELPNNTPTNNDTTTTNDIHKKYSKALEFAKKYSEESQSQ